MTRHFSKSKGVSLSQAERDFIVTSLPAFGWQAHQFESELENEFMVYWFIYEGDCCLGYLAGVVLFGELEVVRVFVSEGARSRGVGGELMGSALGEVGLAFLEARSQNLPAVRLYQRAGFELVSVRVNYYSNPVDDAVIMVWKGEMDE